SQLDALLKQQHYRLSYWRTSQINYRRFFDVTELVSLRMDLPEVFQATHQLLFRLLQEGKVTGLRIDHPDGLWNPKQYFQRLQDASSHSYVVAEKILTGQEPLPTNWPVAGTTGYDFLNRLNGLFINSANKEAFDDLYRAFTGCQKDFKGVAYDSKKLILQTSFISESNALTHRLKQIAAMTRCGQDFSLDQLHGCLTEIISAFPVYRTYTNEETFEIPLSERTSIEQAIRISKSRWADGDGPVFQFIEDILLLRPPDGIDEALRKQCRDFVMKFQQLTGPVTAKGVEDTVFYNFNRLVSLNEVGGDPDEFGISP